MKRKIDKKQPSVKIVRDDEGYSIQKTVTMTSLNFANAERLSAGDLIKHVRLMKIVSITHKEGGSAKLELEIIKKNWENY